MVREAIQLSQQSAFQDSASERGKDTVIFKIQQVREEGLKTKAPEKEQSITEQEQGPHSPLFLQHPCGSWLLGAGAFVAKQREPGGLKSISRAH